MIKKIVHNSIVLFVGILGGVLTLCGCHWEVKDANSPKSNSTSSLPASEEFLTPYFYKRMEGHIGKDLRVCVNLLRSDSLVYGNYYYDHIGELIRLDQGSLDTQQRLRLQEGEFDPTEGFKNTATFEGRFVNSQQFEGNWEALNAANPQPVLLKEHYREGSMPISIKNFKQSHGNCDKDNCVEINFVYPQIESELAAAPFREAFNKTVNQALVQSLAIEAISDTATLDKAAQQAIEEYKSAAKSGSAGILAHWNYDSGVDVICNQNSVLSVELAFYSYTGGAHGAHYAQYVNYNLQTGKPITLNSDFEPHAAKALTSLLLDKAKKSFGVTSFADIGFLIKEEEFVPTDNIKIMPNGISFHYNPYEIASYAMGHIELYVPFSEIKTMLKPNSILRDLAQTK